MADTESGGTFSKGVMLCDRPTHVVNNDIPRAAELEIPAFRAGVPIGVRDQLGLQPPGKEFIATGIAHQKHLKALCEHKKWLKNFTMQQLEVKAEAAIDGVQDEAFRERFKDYNNNLRKCILTSKEPTLHPGVRHIVEARERAEEWGVTQPLPPFRCAAPQDVQKPPKPIVLSERQQGDLQQALRGEGLLRGEDGEELQGIQQASDVPLPPADTDMDMDNFVKGLVDDARKLPNQLEVMKQEPISGDQELSSIDCLNVFPLDEADKVSLEVPKVDAMEIIDTEEKVKKELDEKLSITPELIKVPKTGSKKKAENKPAWALSQDEAERQLEEEEDELLNFIDNLDYDSYIADCEDQDLQEAWNLMKEAEEDEARGVDLSTKDESWKARFVNAMNNLAGRDAAAANSGRRGAMSVGSQRSVAESAADRARMRVDEIRSEKGGDQWDVSSQGDRGEKMQKMEKMAAAQALLAEDPLLRTTHSAKSVMHMLDKAECAPLQTVEE